MAPQAPAGGAGGGQALSPQALAGGAGGGQGLAPQAPVGGAGGGQGLGPHGPSGMDPGAGHGLGPHGPSTAAGAGWAAGATPPITSARPAARNMRREMKRNEVFTTAGQSEKNER